MSDPTRGVYHKFNVTRTDGTSAPGLKHANCFYFVLDCNHDKHAKAALLAYADSCDKEYQNLARDLRYLAGTMPFGNGCASQGTEIENGRDSVSQRALPVETSAAQSCDHAKAVRGFSLSGGEYWMCECGGAWTRNPRDAP